MNVQNFHRCFHNCGKTHHPPEQQVHIPLRLPRKALIQGISICHQYCGGATCFDSTTAHKVAHRYGACNQKKQKTLIIIKARKPAAGAGFKAPWRSRVHPERVRERCMVFIPQHIILNRAQDRFYMPLRAVL